jgi:competence protein ComEA
VNGIVAVMLAGLLLSPGIVAAGERKTTPEATASATTKTVPQRLDLNRASQDELVGVPGIGPRMAQAIVDLRSKKGSFKRLEELLEVTGIKEKKLAAISGYLEVVPVKVSTTATPAVQSR